MIDKEKLKKTFRVVSGPDGYGRYTTSITMNGKDIETITRNDAAVNKIEDEALGDYAKGLLVEEILIDNNLLISQKDVLAGLIRMIDGFFYIDREVWVETEMGDDIKTRRLLISDQKLARHLYVIGSTQVDYYQSAYKAVIITE